VDFEDKIPLCPPLKKGEIGGEFEKRVKLKEEVL